MGVVEDVVAGTADVVKATGQLMAGRTTLVYQAGFADELLDPVVDLLHLGRLQVTQSSNLDHTGSPASFTVVPPQPEQGMGGGARLTLQRPLGPSGAPINPADIIDVGAVVYPFPPGLDLFMLKATFALSEQPDVTNSWASVLFARKGEVRDTITDKRERITVTMQSSPDANAPGGFAAKSNTPGGGPVGTPYPIPEGVGGGTPLPLAVRDAVYSKEPFRSQFRLELLVDRRADIGRAGVLARFHSTPFIQRRWFVHDLIGITKGPITAAGFALAIASGNGPVAVTVTDFRIYSVRRGIFDVLTTLPFVGNAIAGVINDMRL